MKITYIINHNSCSDGDAKFVQPQLHTHKLPLQDDTNLKSMQNCLLLILLRQTVVIGNLRNIKYIEEKSRSTRSN